MPDAAAAPLADLLAAARAWAADDPDAVTRPIETSSLPASGDGADVDSDPDHRGDPSSAPGS